MEILAAYDLTQSYRHAAALVGCAPNTVVRYPLARDAGELKTAPAQRDQLIDVDHQLRRPLPKLRNDLQRVRRVRGQPDRQQAHGQEAADAQGAEDCPPAPPGPNQGAQHQVGDAFKRWYPAFVKPGQSSELAA